MMKILPLPRFAQHTKKCFLLFGFARDRFSLKKERIFFLVFSQEVSGQFGGVNVGKAKQKLFLRRKVFALRGSLF